MRVPDELRECVCFVQPKWSSGVGSRGTARGTAFFVGVPLGIGNHGFVYVVTAKHCVTGDEKARRRHENRPATTAILWVNHREHGRVPDTTRVSDWLLHDSADIAVLPVGGINPDFEIRAWDAEESIADEQVVRDKNIGAGDDVFIAGLLTYNWGETRNLPIVRLGSIAAMPEDPVELETGQDVVTLVEVHSIGGLSGCPVFVHLSVLRDTPEGTYLRGSGAKASSAGTSWLHGVMHGVYPTGKDDPDGVKENLNTGIAIVTRIDRVLDLINHPRSGGKARRVEERNTSPGKCAAYLRLGVCAVATASASAGLEWAGRVPRTGVSARRLDAVDGHREGVGVPASLAVFLG